MPETIKAEKLYKFGKGKGQVKKEFTTTLDEDKNVIGHDMIKYNRAGQKVKQRGFKAKVAATMAKGPIYMMYGKEAAPMMGGSPLAKYGCSKKYKKSGIKMEGEDKLEATILHDTDKGEQTKYKGKMVTIKGNTVTRGGNVVGYVGKDKKIKEN